MSSSRRPTIEALRKVRIARIIAYVDANLHRPITSAELAEVAALSRFHFSRAFKRAFGVSPKCYVARRRAEAACRELTQTSAPIAEVAASLGYSSQSHMTTELKRVLGCTPAMCRRSCKHRDTRIRADHTPRVPCAENCQGSSS